MRDRSDLVNPVLLKELRQGVRGRGFTWAFLLVQIAAVLLTLVSLSNPDNHSDDQAIWVTMAAPVLLLMPLMALDALAGERTAGTLETVLLTRLSARALVWGKWASHAGQAALLLGSLVPFALLRYFQGGVDLWADALLIAIQVVVCALLVAAAIALSSSPLIPGARLLVTLVGGMYLTAMVQFSLLVRLDQPSRGLAGPVATTLLMALVLLEAAAYQVTPAAERRPAVMRVAAMLAVLVGLHDPESGVWRDNNMIAVLAVGMAVATVAGMLLEHEHASYARRLPNRGWKAAFTWLLGPGWPSGVMFAILATVAAGAVIGVTFENAIAAAVSVPGAFFVPLAVMRGLRRFVGQQFRHYAAAQLLLAMLATVRRTAGGLLPEGLRAVSDVICALVPGVWLIGGVDEKTVLPLNVLTCIAATTTTAAVVTLFVQALHAFQDRRRSARSDPEAAPVAA